MAPLLCARSLLVSGRQAVCKTDKTLLGKEAKSELRKLCPAFVGGAALKEHGGQGGLGDVWVEVAT